VNPVVRPGSFMSEVWSFGIFVYEMLTGVTPFECDSPVYDSKVIPSPASRPIFSGQSRIHCRPK
jgi:serine/threonine protein kinase